MDMTHANGQTKEVATLAGGCFWCLEAVFDELRGVTDVVSGYAGGATANPTYRQVCSGTTGHAEVVQVTFDPQAVSFRELLEVFFTIHDPTTLNRQGADAGTQYRSVIFCRDDAQRAAAQAMIAGLTRDKVFDRPIVTAVEGDKPFYIAEDYHQDYYDNNRAQGYCQVVINPKVQKLRAKFADKLKD